MALRKTHVHCHVSAVCSLPSIYGTIDSKTEIFNKILKWRAIAEI